MINSSSRCRRLKGATSVHENLQGPDTCWGKLLAISPKSHPLRQWIAGDVSLLLHTPLLIQALILYPLHDFNSLLTGLPPSSLHLFKAVLLLFSREVVLKWEVSQNTPLVIRIKVRIRFTGTCSSLRSSPLISTL